MLKRWHLTPFLQLLSTDLYIRMKRTGDQLPVLPLRVVQLTGAAQLSGAASQLKHSMGEKLLNFLKVWQEQ